jgi:hypothetical protein
MNEANFDSSLFCFPQDLKTNEYLESLFQCSLISRLIYEDDPSNALQSHQYSHLNHGIKSLCVSKTIDDKESNNISNFDVKYMICDCSKNENQKRLIIGFLGTSSLQDFLVDLDLIGQINNCERSFHSGIYKRSKKIPVRHFIEKLINENYEIILTGHSLGAAIASLVTVEVLTHRAVEDYTKKVQFIGFGSPVLGSSKFKSFIEKYDNNFHFYANENDIVPKLLSILSNTIHSKPEIKVQVDENPALINDFKKFLKILMNPFDNINEEILTNIFSIAKSFLEEKLEPAYVHFGRYFSISDNSLIDDIMAPKIFRVQSSKRVK